MAQESNQRTEVLIGGAGVAGLALAIALKQALGPSFAVAVADPALGRPSADARASAMVAAARRLLGTVGVWERIADDARPILDMHITDSRLNDAARPVFLRFDGDVEPENRSPTFGEPAALAVLVAKAKEEGVLLWPLAVEDFRPRADDATTRGAVPSRTISVRLSDGATVASQLLVAADGMRSHPERAASPPAGLSQRASWRPWRTSAIIMGAPRSISCRRVRLPSCR